LSFLPPDSDSGQPAASNIALPLLTRTTMAVISRSTPVAVEHLLSVFTIWMGTVNLGSRADSFVTSMQLLENREVRLTQLNGGIRVNMEYERGSLQDDGR
jgi:hypothetical protein